MYLEKRSPAEPGRARGAKADFGNLSVTEDSDERAHAQRRLALKLASGAGLSLELASVLVVVALGDGRPG